MPCSLPAVCGVLVYAVYPANDDSEKGTAGAEETTYGQEEEDYRKSTVSVKEQEYVYEYMCVLVQG